MSINKKIDVSINTIDNCYTTFEKQVTSTY